MKANKGHFENLFITAFEGGSSYWAEVLGETPENEGQSDSERWFHHIWNGGSMIVYDAEGGDVLGVATKERMIHGLEMAQSEFDHLDFMECDAESADVWFQFASMGEYTFG